MSAAVAMLFGLAFGSFAEAAIHRIPRGESLFGRSRCDTCRRDLHAQELIPVLSHVMQGGRCRTCAHPIGVRALVLEVMVAALFAVAFSVLAFSTAVIVCTLAMVTVIGVGAARTERRSYD